MPRNTSGVYSLPVAAFSAGTTIKSADVNSDFSDVASALTDSLSVSGKGGMTAPLQAASGTVGAPGYCFGSDTATGFYLSGSHQITFVRNGVAGLVLNSDGSASLGSAAFACGPITLTEISTPSAPSAGSMVFYAKTGDIVAAQTPGGIEYLVGKSPTVQQFISGTGTYTPSAGTVRIRVRMCGGGGGGAAAATNNGSTGSTTSFGSWTAIGGNGGTNGSTSPVGGGLGGTGGATGTGTLIVRNQGNLGGFGSTTVGGAGAGGPFGGGAQIKAQGNGAGNPGVGYGGGGGGGLQNTTGGGGGGGSGEYVEFFVTSPGSLSYTVGGGGNGGTAGTQAGGNGAAGVIIIEEFYN